MTHDLDRNQCIHGRPQKFFQGGGNVEILLILQVADDAIQMNVQKTLYLFYTTSLCWLNLNSQSFVWNVFYTSAIRNVFRYTNYYTHFFENFLQISHNLIIINGQNNMSGEKQSRIKG